MGSTYKRRLALFVPVVGNTLLSVRGALSNGWCPYKVARATPSNWAARVMLARLSCTAFRIALRSSSLPVFVRRREASPF